MMCIALIDEIFQKMDEEIEASKIIENAFKAQIPGSTDHIQAQTYLLGLTKANQIFMSACKNHRDKIKQAREDLKID